MSIRTTADSFRDLAMKPPDLTFMERPEKPGERFGREPLYNTRVLVDNWYEDRRQYKLLCSRCIGNTTYQCHYPPKCPCEEKVCPPRKYQRLIDHDGEGWSLIRNTEDYCPYLQNYMTTYDLMHNWEIRRAGVQPKACRRWKLGQGGAWAPENDNTVAFGNLTQLGYRQAPQVPLLPNDWDIYANVETEYRSSFPKLRYPQDYVHCRKVPTREVAREIDEMVLVKKPVDPCDLCGDAYLYQGGRSQNPKCRCICHQIYQTGTPPKKPCDPTNTPRFGNYMPNFMTQEHHGKQLLHPPKLPHPYKALKHKPMLPPLPCQPNEPKFAVGGNHSVVGDQPPDVCRDYAGDVTHDYKGPLQESPLCECFIRK